MLDWLIYAAIGRLLVFLWQKFPIPEPKKTYISQFIYKLHLCDLCSGVWIYCILALVFGVDIVKDTFGFTQTIGGTLITGAITSFVVHIFVLGWKSKFEVVII